MACWQSIGAGLLRDHPTHSERIVQYRDCLQRCDHTERFYHRSFATDELGTAATLLGIYRGELQANLLRAHAGEPTQPLTWRDDGSLTVVQAETRLHAGCWLVQLKNEGVDTLVVSGADATLLDGMHAAHDKPRLGLREASAFRPALQVLPLALELVWQPLNFYALLQFLSHRRSCRYRQSSCATNKRPGVMDQPTLARRKTPCRNTGRGHPEQRPDHPGQN